MDTKFVTSNNGFHVAYDVHGSGSALLLLHGFSNDRTMWSTHGWIDRLQSQFTVITMDFRGCGVSIGSTNPADYAIEHHLADLHAVMDVCGVDRFRVWGWSFGATIGLHLAARSPRVVQAVIAGTYFGNIFTESYVQRQLTQIEPLARAQAEGRLDQLNLSPEVRAFMARTNLPVYLARLKGLISWPRVEPQDVQCPMLVYTGTADGNVVVQLQKQRATIEAAGLHLHVFDGLNHIQLLSESDIVLPVVGAFLGSA
ncbi:MAG: alpha/beta hydrolase [Anaerolineae bacterium]|nr:alpha/beta hydrolase [Anaerolineae bacterium]